MSVRRLSIMSIKRKAWSVMADRIDRMGDKFAYKSASELFRDEELLACMANLFARESGIRLPEKSMISRSAIDRLKERGWITAKGRLADKTAAYSCYEYVRQLYRTEPLDQLLIEEADGRRRIADICCGGGATILALLKAERRERVCGIDAASGQIELLRELLEIEAYGERVYTSIAGTTAYAVDSAADGQRIETHIGDVHRLPWPEESFDLVICRASLHYLDIKRSIAEMYRVLEPGGKLYLLVHGPGYPFDYLVRRRGIWSRDMAAYALRKLRAGWGTKPDPGLSQGRYLRRRQVESLLLESGFESMRYYMDEDRMIAGRWPVYFAIVAEKRG
ncbi:class I SAM-dependent methyltransferase [Paenibacillus pinisoli]|uniref:Class I SAM-dependent methyltransferase n=1 Tax=Paenibacillus pinisoli TaxID=1276110 RepID=A0A3A6PX95_9BACL|nr:class I SAM-dependent methyltransferase [Paenibacillus pinisoli]RJX40003.1 class I SAM-dependent methyltransferase [Paenibacillus pinisoli]